MVKKDIIIKKKYPNSKVYKMTRGVMYIVGMWDQIKVMESATIIYQVAGTQSISNPSAQRGAFKGNEPLLI